MSKFLPGDLLHEAVRRNVIASKASLRLASTDTGHDRAAFVLKHLHEEQLKFVMHPSKRKAALCTRRAGKTTGVAAGMLYTALRHTSANIAYFAPTADDARDLIYKKLLEIHEQYGIPVTWHAQRMTFTYANESEITLIGVSDIRALARGLGRAFHLVVTDESASFGHHFKSLVKDTLLPTLADWDGALWMIGTPQPVCVGFFYEVTSGEISGWETFSWSVFDNPYLPDFVRWRQMNPDGDWKAYAKGPWLKKTLESSGDRIDDPSVQRNWFARWTRDNSSLVYAYNEEINTTYELPDMFGWRLILGVDLGQKSALAIVAYNRTVPYCVVVKSQQFDITLTDELGKIISNWRAIYKKIDKVIVDYGNIGRQVAEDLRVRWRLPITPAAKQHKLSYQNTMNSDFKTGRIKVYALGCKGLIEEWSAIQKDPDTGEELKNQRNHQSDACLYAWRYCRHFFSKEEEVPLNPENPVDLELIIEQQAIAQAKSAQEEIDELYTLWR